MELKTDQIDATVYARLLRAGDTIERFVSAGKFCSYSGLVNSTYRSGGKTFHGGLIPTCNRRLRYAFIEAAWTASRTSP